MIKSFLFFFLASDVFFEEEEEQTAFYKIENFKTVNSSQCHDVFINAMSFLSVINLFLDIYNKKTGPIKFFFIIKLIKEYIWGYGITSAITDCMSFFNNVHDFFVVLEKLQKKKNKEPPLKLKKKHKIESPFVKKVFFYLSKPINFCFSIISQEEEKTTEEFIYIIIFIVLLFFVIVDLFCFLIFNWYVFCPQFLKTGYYHNFLGYVLNDNFDNIFKPSALNALFTLLGFFTNILNIFSFLIFP